MGCVQDDIKLLISTTTDSQHGPGLLVVTQPQINQILKTDSETPYGKKFSLTGSRESTNHSTTFTVTAHSHCYSPSVNAHPPWSEFKPASNQEWMYFRDFKCAPRYFQNIYCFIVQNRISKSLLRISPAVQPSWPSAELHQGFL